MTNKLSKREKIGFSLGDMAGNFVYQSVVLLLAFYYTDVYGLDAATVTSIFLLVRIFDAITDPLMGILVDRTQTRWGKYRPYLLWLCVPYAIASVLVFTVPEYSEQGKIIYAYATYALLMLLFTATNIPYFALGSVMTADPKERLSLNSYRFVAAALGGLVITAGLIPLADILGEGDQATGYRLAMMVMATFSVILFLICFSMTRERIKPTNSGAFNIKSDIKQVLQNDQWRLLALAILLLVTFQTIKQTIGIFYLKYYVDDALSYVSIFLSLWMIGSILGAGSVNYLTAIMCKKQAWVLLCLISTVLSAFPYFVPSDQIVVILGTQFFVGFFSTMMAPLLFSTMADVTDYGELMNKRRLDGLISSFTIFSVKIGLAIGGATATYLLTVYDYQSGGVPQTDATASGILLTFTLIPAVGIFLTGMVVRQMKLSSKVVEQNSIQLIKQRNEKDLFIGVQS